VETFVPIPPPPPTGAAPQRRVGSEDATAAHRPVRAEPYALPPASPAAELGENGGENSQADSPAQPAAVRPPPSPATPPARPAESPDADSTTAPHQPSQDLLDAARPTQPGATQRPRREDETVRFSTEQTRRARRDSRPESPLPDQAPAAPIDPNSETRAIDAREQAELLQLLEEFQPQEPQAGPASGDGPDTAQSERLPSLSEPPMAVTDGELSPVDGTEGIEPLTAERDETDFSGLDSDDPGAADDISNRVTAPPPPLPSQRRVLPPPLPRQRAFESVEGRLEGTETGGSDDEPAVPLVTIRQRMEEARTRGISPTQTVRMDPSNLMTRLNVHIDSFVGRLEELSRNTRDDIIYVEVSLSDSRLFRFSDATECSPQHRNPLNGYFRIRVIRPGEGNNTGSVNQYALIGEPILPGEMGFLRSFIQGLFNPNPQPLNSE
jgi:hypothetical protein